MMVVCVDLRIPLFVIGKPGSSKSLAKTLVSNCMRGRFSESKLFSKLKQANMMSYQCSALSDAAGIIHTFEQCCDMQENNDSNTFTSVAVLDEIGLAEDSPAMPLKVLHPLLEFGSMKSNERGHQVAFLGISNWPLDPAKLNRGVFLFHENPGNEDLYKTATEICAINEQSHPNAQKILRALTNVYLEIENCQVVEYFGLRDFYSLIKSCNGHFGNPESLFNAVERNFGGVESVDVEKFKREICKIFPHSELVSMPIKEVVQTNLGETDSRYLLLLTNYYPSINLVSLVVENFDKMKVIVGSAFPGDQTFAKICRNIQEVKTCMETGTPVVMLNLAEIQESLYDALNQHYNTLGGKRYVDIGLGGQRLKCCVAKNFRLIILEKKDKAYTEYPIPLLNRLEKHLLDSDGLLPESENNKMLEVQKWTELFVTVDFQKSDSMVGHQKDTVSSTLLLCPDIDECKEMLLQSATLDAMYRIKKNNTDLDQMKKLHSTYFEKQSHYKLTDFLNRTLGILGNQKKLPISMFEIVSYSGILVGNDREQLEKNLNLEKYDVMILNIRQFYTLREFEHDVEIFLQECRDYKQDTSKKINAKILVLQCPQAHKYAKLIECAKHSWSNKDKTGISIPIIVIVLWSIDRNTEFLMQQAQDNRIIYIDEVSPFQTDETEADATERENVFSTETLLNTNLVDIFAPKNACNKSMKKFLQDSLSKAMTKLEGSQIASTRFKARVKTLTNLLQTDEKIGKNFRSKFLDKIHKILMSEETLKSNNWIHVVANSKKSLQEGGTFHKALLLYLKTLISNLIAHFICNIDVQCNLNLIKTFPDVHHQDGYRTENMWLSMFEKLTFDHLRPDWMHKEFIAVSPIAERPTLACKFPFGCKVTGSLQTHLISILKSSSKDCNASLVNFFRKHDLYPVINNGISTYPELLQGYVHDLVNSHYTPSSEQHLETEVNAVIKLVEKRAFVGKDNVEQADKLPLVYATFIDLKDKLRILREVFKVSPLVAESINTLTSEKFWNWHNGDIHHWGMLKALEDLRQKTTFFSENPESCLSWLEQAKSIEKTVYLVHDCIQEQEKKDELMIKWLPISLVNVLLLQLIPNNEYKFEYTEVVANSAELLVSVQDEQNIEDLTIIVCNTIGRCYDDLRIKILLSWEEMTCNMCKEDMEDPQCLTCGHFFCLQCCEEILIDDSPKCTQCLTIISKDEPYEDDTLSKSDKKRLQQFQFSCTSFFIEFLKTICFSSVMKPINKEKMKSFIKLVFTLLFQTDNDRKLESSAIGSDINTKACLFGELVKNEQVLVTEEINKTLQQASANEKREISQFIIYHFEQRLLFEKSNSVNMQELENEHLILHSHQPTLETLKSIATLRNACRNLAIQLYEKSKQYVTEMDDIINSFIDFCKRSKVIDVKQLVIKAGCAQFGIDWYREMLKSEVAKGLIPEKWKTAINEYDTDHWLLFDAILTEVEGGLRKPLQSRDDFMSELAAKPPSREKLYFAVKRKYQQGLNCNSHITNDEELGFFIKINNQVCQVFRNINPDENLRECGSVQLLVMFVATVINKGCHMMSGFAQFALKPNTTSRLSLPTMFTENTGSYREDTTWIVQFILHASILIGYINNSQAVKIMLKGSIRTHELDKYLTEKLCTILRNLKGLWKMDMHDTFLIMHHVLEQIWDTEYIPNMEIFNWITLEGRCQWKNNFQEKYLSSTVSVDSINETLMNIKTEKNRRLVQSNLFKFLHDGDMTDDDLDKNLLWKRESLCCYTELCCLERLQQVLNESKKAMGCVLKTVLATENINLIQGLETVLKLHRILIERCQGFSYENVEKKQLKEYLKNDVEEQIAESYLNLWNKVMPTLRSKAAVSALLTEHIYELSMSSPVAMFLPSNIGQGQCAKKFAEYLIDVQNTLIDECKVSENVTCKFDEIDVSDVKSAHLICIEKHRDILPLIQTHAVYTIEKDEFGEHHNVIYKLDVLEKQVEVKFLKDKRLIRKKTLPRIWYSSNTGMESDWKDMISMNYEQNELPVNLKMQTDGLASYSSILYSAVRSLEDGIRRLATVHVDPKTRLKIFLEDECKISSAELEGIPSMANIEHTLAMYSRLSWHRSKLYFSRGLDPYSEILPEGSQEEIKKPIIGTTQGESTHEVKSTHEKLNAVLQNADINVCQQHINEVIIRLPGTSPEKRLAKEVFPHVNSPFFSQVKTRQWYSGLPDDIRFKHISYLFKQTMKLQSK
uniref:E3 ubiquitin-protein ligase rnf213-alpha-like n=1 Tax=Styela clava TaxID=7725 RepID=UPI0019395A6E|nr:E3 ubiquitin-protein ligase rnf213-alpha-like [Styela clava]